MKPIATEQWPSQCSSIRTNPSHRALHPKSKYMTLPNVIGPLLFSKIKPDQNSSQQIRNHNTISRNCRDNISSTKPVKIICSQPLKKNIIIHPSLQSNIEKLKLSKPRMGATRSKLVFIIDYYYDILSL